MSARWSLEQALPVLTDEGPRGLVDLWAAVPQGASGSTTGMAALVDANQQAIVGRLATVQQQVAAAAGVTAGYRPELVGLLAPVLERGSAAQQAAAALLMNTLELSGVFDTLENLVAEQLENVLAVIAEALGIVTSVVGLVPFLGQLVAVVTWVIKTVAQQVAQQREADRIAELIQAQCKPPIYTAAMDEAWSQQAVTTIIGGDWSRLFLPETRLRDPSFEPWPNMAAGRGNDGVTGPTCCPSALDRFTVIVAPIGVGLGNRLQNFFPPVLHPGQPLLGLGCLPMLPTPVHRAMVVSPTHGTYDAGRDLPELGGVGAQAWRTIWNRGPAAWAVDSAAIASAWEEYIQLTVRTIAVNPETVTFGGKGPGVCGDWTTAKRLAAARNIARRFGAREETAAPDGIHTFDDATPVVAWRATEAYQASMLERVSVLYCDARTCAPAWRQRVEQAQQEALTSSRVCDVELDSIADPALAQAVYDEQRRRGVVCYALAGKTIQAYDVSATSGPSTEPLGDTAPELPELPEIPKPPRASSTSADFFPFGLQTGPSPLGLAIGGAAVLGLAWWLGSKGKGGSHGLR